MDENINLEDAFGDMAQEEFAPQAEQAQTPQEVEPEMVSTVTPEEAAQEAVSAPEQFDPSVIQNEMQSQSDAIAELARNIALMNEPKVEKPTSEPTEEDMIRERARKELGLDELDAKFKKQEEMLKQQNEYIEHIRQQDAIKARESEFKSMEQEFGNIDREAIQNHIMEVGKTNPNLADALNSPEGVRMLLKQGVGAVVKTPDAITPSASGTDVNVSDATSRVLEGKGTSDDFGDLLASYAM